MLRYCLIAGVLGVGWFLVLLIPGITGEWLLADVWQNLVSLVVASVLVAVLFRKFIGGASSLKGHLVRAVVIPYLGCLVFLSLFAAILWARNFLFGGLANIHDTVSVCIMGMTAAALSFFVIIPYGLLCQYIMNSLSHSKLT